MNTKNPEFDWLQQNIAMLKNLSGIERAAAIKTFHKVGHIILYAHQEMRFESVALDECDSIDADLSFEALKDTNNSERFALIIMGGVMMEQLISQSEEVSEYCETEIEKAILLISTVISNTSKNLDYYLIIANLACQILIENQKSIGKIYQTLTKNRVLTYSQIQVMLSNH